MEGFIVTDLMCLCFSTAWIHLMYDNYLIKICTTATDEAISGSLIILNSKIPYQIQLFRYPDSLLYSYFCVFLCFAARLDPFSFLTNDVL